MNESNDSSKSGQILNDTTDFLVNQSSNQSNFGGVPSAFIVFLDNGKTEFNQRGTMDQREPEPTASANAKGHSNNSKKAGQFEEDKNFEMGLLTSNKNLLGTPSPPQLSRKSSDNNAQGEEENITQIFNQKAKKSFMPRGSRYFQKALVETFKLANFEEDDDNMLQDQNSYMSSFKRQFNVTFDYDKNLKDPVTQTPFFRNQETPGDIVKNGEHFKQLEVFLQKNKASLLVVKFVISIFADFIQAVLAFSSVIIYIAQTYGYEYSAKNELSRLLGFGKEGVNYLFVTELVVTIMGTIDYIYSFFEAKSKIPFIISPPAIVDLITMIPFYLALIFEEFSGGLSFLHVLQIFKILRVLRLWRLFRDSSWDKNQSEQQNLLVSSRFFVMRRLVILTCSVIAIMFIGAGVFREIDAIIGDSYMFLNEENRLVKGSGIDLFDGFYLMAQVLMTSGLGDVVPVKVTSRVLLISFIVLLAMVIYDQATKLKELYLKLSPHDFEYKGSDHVIILGDCPEYSLHRFLYEAFSSMDLRAIFKRTLIVSTKEPSHLMMSMLQNQLFEGKVKYITCSLSIESLYLNCKLEKAKAAFILTDHVDSESMESTDYSVMLLAKTLHDCRPYMRKIIQVNQVESAQRLYHYMHSAPMTTIYSTRFIKSKIISASIFAQGVTTIFGNFLNSHSTTPFVSNMNDIIWFLEYGKSIKQEIYCMKFSEYFSGLKFDEVVEILYISKSKANGNGILLFGVKSFSLHSQSTEIGSILINPCKYRIKKGDYALLIANDIEAAEFVSNYTEQLDLTDAQHIQFQRLEVSKECYEAINKEFQGTIQKERSFKISMKQETNVYNLYFNDLTGQLSGHIIIVCPIEYFGHCLPMIRQRTSKPVLYLSDKPAGSIWERNSLLFPNIIYGQCDLFDIEQLNNAAIQDAFHVIIFSVREKSSISSDSTTLLLVNTLDCFFDVPYTFELYDENQMRFLGDKAQHDISNCSFQYWPKFIAGKVFLSSLIDSMATVVYLNDIVIEVLTALFDDTEQRKKPRITQGKSQFVDDSSMDDYQDEFIWKINATDEDIIENPGLLIQNKSIFRIPLPQPYVGKRWVDLVKDFLSLEYQVLPIALSTSRYSKAKAQSTGFAAGHMSMAQIVSTAIKKVNKNTPGKKIFDQALEDKKYLESPLVVTNPLQTTRLLEGDFIIIMGNVIDRKAMRTRAKNFFVEKPNPNTTKTYIESLVRQKQLFHDSQENSRSERALMMKKAEFLELSLRNIKQRMSFNVDYDQKIKRKAKVLRELQEKISLLREDLKKKKRIEEEAEGQSPASPKEKLVKIIVRKLLGEDGKKVRENLKAGRAWDHNLYPNQTQKEIREPGGNSSHSQEGNHQPLILMNDASSSLNPLDSDGESDAPIESDEGTVSQGESDSDEISGVRLDSEELSKEERDSESEQKVLEF